jgi:predicted nucleic acid-binding protein
VIDVVIDTNVLVAAVRSSLGTSYRLLQTIEQRRWRPVISPDTTKLTVTVQMTDVAGP